MISWFQPKFKNWFIINEQFSPYFYFFIVYYSVGINVFSPFKGKRHLGENSRAETSDKRNVDEEIDSHKIIKICS